jgi:predicted nucleotidyltransferase
MAKDKIILDLAVEVKNKLKERFKSNLVSVCLFGSAARKTLRKGSDIDFLVVIEKANSSYHKRIKEILPMVSSIRESKKFLCIEALHLDLEPSFLILSKEELKAHPPILIDITEEGIILEDKDDFLRKELASIKEKLTHFGTVKKITPQGYYWIIKPDIKPGEVFEI